jgi:peptidoglycan/xylan/chitin deacetylase (PgdA/CDA1 family)
MLRETLKNLLAGLLYRSGLLTLLLRRKFAGRAVVLTYHRVLPVSALSESYSHPAIVVAPELFARHIALMNRHFTCLGLDEFHSRLKRKDFAGAAYCLITFDDAWRDNHTYAFTALKQTRTPAVIFVPVDYVDSGRLFWQERLGHIVDRICERLPDRAAQILGAYGWQHLPALPQADRILATRTAIRAIKHKDYTEINAIMSSLETQLGEPVRDFGPDAYLSIEQMRDMHRHGIDFQSHACSHRILTRLPADEVELELTASRQWLMEQLGIDATALAYPNGDHSPELQRLAAKAGYRLAFTTESGCVDPQGDPYTVRRINLNDNAAGSEARLLLTLLMSA